MRKILYLRLYRRSIVSFRDGSRRAAYDSYPTYLLSPMLPSRITWSWLSQLLSQGVLWLGKKLRRLPWLSVPVGLTACLTCWMALLHSLVSWEALGPLPAPEELRPLPTAAASSVYTIDGQLLGKFFLEERSPVAYEALPKHLCHALIATEDIRFYEHAGVDYQSLLRVLFKTILLDDERAGGGSTLSMQLAKNLFPRQSYPAFSLLINKLREIVIAERLEAVFAKPKILTHYLNTVSFGENAYGIETAAQRFFHRSCSELTVTQSALLVGMLKAPSTYNPRLHPEAARLRRDVVLGQMQRYGYLSRVACDSLRREPVALDYFHPNHHDGPAPYFLAHVRKEVMRWAKTHPKPEGSYWDPYRDGLKIVTPLHSQLQAHARAAVAEQMLRIQRNFERDWRGVDLSRKFRRLIDLSLKRSPHYLQLKNQGYDPATIDSLLRLPRPMTVFSWEGPQQMELSPRDSVLYHELMMQAGFMAMDPNSGQVRAWVGGIDHRWFQYDHVTSRRQTGSVFKPLVYAAALAGGMAPCAYIPNERVVFQEYGDWAPKNADNIYGGEYSLQGGLTQSVNVVAVNLLMEVGAQRVVDLARQLGVNEDVPAVPSIALGSAEASLAEMLRVYAAFVNGGTSLRPISILRIEDAAGRQLYHGMTEADFEPVLKPETAALITFMLRNVVNQGTARSLRTRFGLRNDIAGKTGTTQAQTDGWFIGATPDLLAGAWVGANHPQVHFRSMLRGQGAATALPIWGSFFKRVLADSAFEAWQRASFTLPSDSLNRQLDCADLWFPLAMSEFRTWWLVQKRKDSLQQARPGGP
jgi:penicillin-binding protein 1A